MCICIINLKYFDEFDYYSLTSSNGGKLAFYDLNDNKVGGIDNVKTDLRFQMPSATYAIFSTSSVPSSFTLNRIAYNDLVLPRFMGTNNGYSELQDRKSHSVGTSYYVSKANLIVCTKESYMHKYEILDSLDESLKFNTYKVRF